jgi:hypothetical protein
MSRCELVYVGTAENLTNRLNKRGIMAGTSLNKKRGVAIYKRTPSGWFLVIFIIFFVGRINLPDEH